MPTPTSNTSAPGPRRQFALYARATSRSKGRLVTIMFDERAAESHADALCAAKGYVAVEVRPITPGEVAPESIA